MNLLRSADLVPSFCFVISGVREDSFALENRLEEVREPSLPPELEAIVILGWH